MNREPTSQFHPLRVGPDPRSATKPEPGLNVTSITTHSTNQDVEEHHYHTPLTSNDSIRVLDLLPALDRRAPVRCRLREVALARAGAKYEALSYVWGSPAGTRAITCDGRRLLVTPNCHDALVHLRGRLRSRALWIDAVCVDQRRDAVSTRERNRQVALMGAIYRTAALVVIWLGVAGPETARVVRLFRDLYRCRIELPQAHGRRKPLYRLVRGASTRPPPSAQPARRLLTAQGQRCTTTPGPQTTRPSPTSWKTPGWRGSGPCRRWRWLARPS